METEVFCEDCKVFVKLSLFSKNHKRHEMKLAADLMNEKKEKFLNQLELKKLKNNNDLSNFEKTDKNWQEIQTQVSLIKASLDNHSEKLVKQIEVNRLFGYKTVDTELSKLEKNFIAYKNEFIDSENNKLSKLKSLIENLDEISMRTFTLPLQDLSTKSSFCHNEIKLFFQPAIETIIHDRHLPQIKTKSLMEMVFHQTTQSTSKEATSEQKPSENFKPVSTVIPILTDNYHEESSSTTPPASESKINETNSQPTNLSKNFTESVYGERHRRYPYILTEDELNLYVLYKKCKSVEVYSKQSKKMIENVSLDFCPCDMVRVGDLSYFIDFKMRILYIIKLSSNCFQEIDQIPLNSKPTYLSVSSNDDVLITSDKNVCAFNPLDSSVCHVEGTSHIGRVLRCWDYSDTSVFIYIVLVHNMGQNKLLRMQEKHIKDEYNVKRNFLHNEFLINVNCDGVVIILLESRLLLLNSDLGVTFSQDINDFTISKISNVFINKQKKITITYKDIDYHLCRSFRLE